MLSALAACTDAMVPRAIPFDPPATPPETNTIDAKAKLDAAMALWEAHGSDSYEADASVWLGGSEDYLYRLIVQEGRLVTVFSLQPDSLKATDRIPVEEAGRLSIMTIESTFDMLSEAIGLYRYHVNYDRHYGFPVALLLSNEYLQYLSITFSNFKPTGPSPMPTPSPTPTNTPWPPTPTAT